MSNRFSEEHTKKLQARVRHAGDIRKRQWDFNAYVEELQTDILQVFDGDVTGPSVGLHGHYPSQIDPKAAIALLTMEDYCRDFKSESVPT